MGKIVKRAEFKDEKYVVQVPHVEPVREFVPAQEHGDFFGVVNAATVRVDVDPFDQAIAAAPKPEFDLEAVKAEAAEIVDGAHADAEAILAQAQQRANEILEAAQANAVQFETEARDRGHEQGVATGKAEADAEMESMMLTMRELIASARAERHEIIESAESELVRLALAIAERVIHQHIAIEPGVVVDTVRNALTRLVSREVVTLRVHPADLEMIRGHRDAIVASNDVEHLRIVEDQRVDRGGVVIETESGTIDAKIATQLREARRAIAGDEPIVAQSVADGVLQSPAQAS